MERRLALSAGSFDLTFGNAGVLSLAPLDSVHDVAALANGGFMVAGSLPASGSTPKRPAVLRFTSTGVPDPTFGTAGMVTLNPTIGAVAYSVAVRSDASVYVGGETATSGGFLVRLSSTGVLDSSFGAAGLASTSFTAISTTGLSIRNLVLQADGRVLASGIADRLFSLGRYSESGIPESTFAGDGLLHAGSFGSSTTNPVSSRPPILVTSTGRVILASDATDADWLNNGTTLAAVAASGSIDQTFGSSGTIFHDFFTVDVESIAGDEIAVLSGGWGAPGPRRLSSSGATIPPSGSYSWNLTMPQSMAVDGNGKLLLFGTVSSPPSTQVGVVRYHADGTTDWGFTPGVLTIGIPGANVVRVADVDRSGTEHYLTAVNTTSTPVLVRAVSEVRANEAPTFTVSPDVSVPEGASLDLTDVYRAVDLDGSVIRTEIDSNYDGSFNPTGGNPNLFNAAGIDGPAKRTIAIRATDNEGATTIRTIQVNIANVAPSARVSGQDTVIVGTPYILELDRGTDSASDTITRWTIDWGDGTGVTEHRATDRIATHTYTEGAPTRTIKAWVHDEDGQHPANNMSAHLNFGNGSTLGLRYLPNSWLTTVCVARDSRVISAYVSNSSVFLEVFDPTTPGSSTTVDSGVRIADLSYISAMAETHDGGFVISGYAYNAVTRSRYEVAVRLTSSLAPLRTFGGEGYVKTIVNTTDLSVSAVVGLSDGGVVLFRQVASQYQWVRYSAAGLFDSTFGTTGVVNSNLQFPKLYPTPDGGFIAHDILDTSLGAYTLLKLRSNGSLDSSFGLAGKLKVAEVGGSARWTASAIDAEGSVILGQIVYSGEGVAASREICLTRIKPDGTIDLSFGDGGFARTADGAKQLDSLSVAVDSSDRIYFTAVNSAIGAAGGSSASIKVLGRLSRDGKTDPTFNLNGMPVQRGVSASDPAVKLTLFSSRGLSLWTSPDGSVYLVGLTESPTTPNQTVMAALRYAVEAPTVAVEVLTPQLTLSGPTAPARPGLPVELRYSGILPKFAPITRWEIQWGDGSKSVLPGGDSGAATHTFASESLSYNVVATAFTATGSHQITTSFSVLDPVPTAMFNVPATVNESAGPVSISLTPTGGRAVRFLFDTDNNGTFELSSSGTLVLPAALTADGDRTLILSGRVEDSWGRGTSYTAQLRVLNITPTANLSVSASANGATATFLSPVDGQADLANLRYSYDFNDDGVFEIVGSPAATISVPSQYVKVGSEFTVRGRVVDPSGAFTEYRSRLLIPNTPPVGELKLSNGRLSFVSVEDHPLDLPGIRYLFDLDNDGLYVGSPGSTSFVAVPADLLMPGSDRRFRGRLVDPQGASTDYELAISLPKLIASVTSPAEVSEGAGKVVFTVNLNSGFELPIRVRLGWEGSVLPQGATIPDELVVPANATSVSFTVSFENNASLDERRHLNVNILPNDQIQPEAGAAASSTRILDDDVQVELLPDPRDRKGKARVLSVLGSDLGEVVEFFTNRGGTTRVAINGATRGIFARHTLIRVHAGGGNDIIRMSPNLATPAFVDAGDGDDAVYTSRGRDLLIGGAGADTLASAAGNDMVIGAAVPIQTSNLGAAIGFYSTWFSARSGRVISTLETRTGIFSSSVVRDSTADRLDTGAGSDQFIIGEEDRIVRLDRKEEVRRV